MTPRTNENLAEWMLLLYLLQTQNEYEVKPRYRNLKKHHIDGVQVHRDYLSPYRETLTKYIDVCEVIENTSVIPVTEINHITHAFEIVGSVVRDKIEI